MIIFCAGSARASRLALLSVAISLCVGVATAVALDRSSLRGREIMSTLFLSPLVVPPVVTGFALLLFLSRMGLVSGFARLLCGHIIITVPYTIRATLARLSVSTVR